MGSKEKTKTSGYKRKQEDTDHNNNGHVCKKVVEKETELVIDECVIINSKSGKCRI